MNYKGHLRMLPIPEPGDIPDSQPEMQSDYCVYVPLFSAFRNGDLDENYIHSAVWALLTWKRFSDADEFNVPVYIWLENEVYEEVNNLLINKFNVPESCIIHGSAGPCLGISQTMGPCFDPQFDAYRYKVILDSEMLVIAPPGEKLRFFEAIAEAQPEGLGVAVKWVLETPISDTMCKYWLRYHLPEGHSSLYDRELEDVEAVKIAEQSWLDTVESLSNQKTREFFDTVGTPFQFPLGALRVFDTHYMDLDWWTRAVTELKDEEAAFSIWYEMDRENNKLWEVSDLPFGVEHVISHDVKTYDYFMPIKKPFIYNFCNNVIGFLHSHFRNSLGRE